MRGVMKKTTRKLELKRSTVRILQPSALHGVAGALPMSNAYGTCSGTCHTCAASACECHSLWTYCNTPTETCDC
jgi:hypothetical protein